MRTTTPAERLLQEVIDLSGFVNVSKKPGAVIERLPAAWREILKTLTSDDVKDVRVDGNI